MTLYQILLIVEMIFMGFIFIKMKKNKIFLHEPILFFILGSSFIYFFVPFLMSVFHWSWHHIQYSESGYIKANLFSLFFILFAIFSYIIFLYITGVNNIKNDETYILEPLNNKEIFFLIIFILIPVIIDTIFLLKYIMSFDYDYYLKNRIILRKGLGLFILISYMASVLIPILYAHIFIKGVKKNKIMFFMLVILTLFFIYTYSLMGNRLTIFVLVMMIILVYYYITGKKISFFKIIDLIIFLIIVFIFFILIGYARAMRVSIFEIDYNFFFNALSYEIEHSIVSNFGNFEHLVWLIEKSAHWSILWGKTFIAGFLNIIPRSIWPSKWLGGGPHLKNIIEPGSYSLNGDKVTSYTTGLIVESFMNFRYFAVFIIGFLMGCVLFLLKYVLLKIKKTKNIILFVLYIYITFSITFMLMFGEFLGIYSRTLIVSIPYFIIYFLSKKRG
jgi:oligosaccharide repeat unit polymerase